MSPRNLSGFEARASGADSAVWSVLSAQVRNLNEAEDVMAVMTGAMVAITRLIHNVSADATAETTARLMASLAKTAAKAVAEEKANG